MFRKLSALVMVLSLIMMGTAYAENYPKFAQDEIKLSNGKSLKIAVFEHASLVVVYDGVGIYIDPVGLAEDFKNVPPASLILLTHGHPDHYDIDGLLDITQKEAKIITTADVLDSLSREVKNAPLLVMNNGESKELFGVKIEAVPAYNFPPNNAHPQGVGNGYVLNIDNKRIYIAGDTDDIPEMRALKNIDVAFLPMNLPFTMTPEKAADAVKAFKPKVVYPYHYRSEDMTLSDIAKFGQLLKDVPGVEVRLRNWYPYDDE